MAVAGGVMFSRRLSIHLSFRALRLCEHIISATPSGYIFRFCANVHPNSKMNSLHFGPQRSESLWPHVFPIVMYMIQQGFLLRGHKHVIMSTRLWPQIKSHGSIKVSVTGVSNMHAPLWPISSDFVWHWQINKDVNKGRYWSFVISIVSNSLQSEIVKLFSLQTKNKKRFWYLYFHTYYLHHSPHPSLDAF